MCLLLYTDTRIIRTFKMIGQHLYPVEPDEQQLVNDTNKIPTLNSSRKLVCNPHKVPRLIDDAEIVTGSGIWTREKRERLVEHEGRVKWEQSLANNQIDAEIIPCDGEECPTFQSEQDSSACTHETPPSAQRMHPPGDSAPITPQVRKRVDD